MTQKSQWVQKIYFGPPGCGKSFHVRKVAIDDLKIATDQKLLKTSPNMIETTFHPEYGYGDLVVKLLPQSVQRTVAYKLKHNESSPFHGATFIQTPGTSIIEYRMHAGPLIKALARAYANPTQNVLLVIDEINRGNCAQIFGDIFQLLDREDNGWSEYGVDPSDLIMDALKQELLEKHKIKLEGLPPEVLEELSVKDDEGYKLRLPPNLSIIATMNISDESVYYMDTAFKRRWDFEYMPWVGTSNTPELQKSAKIEGTEHNWVKFLEQLNKFIAHRFQGRNVDDKQIGVWFIKARCDKATATVSKPTAIKELLIEVATETPVGEVALVNDLRRLFSDIGSYKAKIWENAIKAHCNEPVDVPSIATQKENTVDVKGIGNILVDVLNLLKKKHEIVTDTPSITWLQNTFSVFCKKETFTEWEGAFNEYKKDQPLLKEVEFISEKHAERPNVNKLGNFFLLIVNTHEQHKSEAYKAVEEDDKYGGTQELDVPKESGSYYEKHYIQRQDISNKLMFFLWDNVFSRDRSLLEELLTVPKNSLCTFGDFASNENVTAFIESVMAVPPVEKQAQ